MTERLTVLMGDQVAGDLVRERGDRLTFRYDADYRSRDDATPLSVSMPLQIHEHVGQVVRRWTRGLLPDDDLVLERWARQFQVTSSPFSLLSSPVGRDCAGAARFVPDDELDSALARDSSVRWLDPPEIAQRMSDLRRDTTSWLGTDFAGRFSLAGAQAKTALLRLGDRWGVPDGAAATSHILKPAIAGFDDHDVNEHLCLRAAEFAGLVAARSEIATFEDVDVLVVERFDRERRGATLVRVHQEDLCQALGVSPASKYQSEGGPGPADIARLMWHTMPARVANVSVWRFADALVWNWVIAGTDAHAKNYGLLLAGSGIRLAPLYDIASALPYGTHERRLHLAMKLGDKGYGVNGQRRSTWTALAGQLGLDDEQLRARARALVTAAPDAFARAASELSGLDSTMPARLVAAVAERAPRCAATLASVD